MQEVYSNAIINIGASHASQPSQGCYVQGTRLADSNDLIFIHWSADSQSDSGHSTSVKSTITSGFHAEGRFEETIFKRAWIIQERLLAQRMLNFGRDRISWECLTAKYLGAEAPDPRVVSISTSYDYAGPGVFQDLRVLGPESPVHFALPFIWSQTFFSYPSQFDTYL